MKKILTFALTLAMVLTVSACGKPTTTDTSKPETSGTQSANTDTPADGTVFTMKVAHVDPVGSNEDKLAQKFKELLEERSGGRIKVDVYPAAQLGSENATVESVQMNAVQMTIPSAAAAARFYAPTNIFMMPFYLKGSNEAEKYQNLKAAIGSVWDELNEGMIAKSNMRLTAPFWYGDRTITNNIRPITTPADLVGINLRVPDQELYTKIFTTLGANTTPIDYSELYMALSQGVVDGQDNPIANIIVKKMYEVQKYLTVTGHISQIQLPVISEKFYQSLPADLQTTVLECATEACEYASELNVQDNMAKLESCIEMGMEVAECDRDAFVEATKNIPSQMLDADSMKLFEKLLAALEEASANNQTSK